MVACGLAKNSWSWAIAVQPIIARLEGDRPHRPFSNTIREEARFALASQVSILNIYTICNHRPSLRTLLNNKCFDKATKNNFRSRVELRSCASSVEIIYPPTGVFHAHVSLP